MRLRPGSKALIRDLNTNLVLDTLRRYGPCARSEVVARTRLGRSTVSEILGALLQAGMLDCLSRAASSGGRPAELIRLAPLARLSAGFAVSSDRLTGVLLDLYGLPITNHSLVLNPRPSPLGLAGMIRASLGALLNSLSGALQDSLSSGTAFLAGAGLALPGVVDPREGMVLEAGPLGWEHLPLRSLLKEFLDLPVSILSNAQGLALAERSQGHRPGGESLVAVLVDDAISAGIIAGGQLYLGAGGGAGDLSHWPGGASKIRCPCGRKGCLRTVASETGVLKAAGLSGDWLSGPNLATSLDDPRLRAALERAGQALGSSLASLANLLNPELIVLGGRLSAAAGPLLLEPLRHSFFDRASPMAGAWPQVLPSHLGEAASAIGAGIAVLEHFFRPPLYDQAP